MDTVICHTEGCANADEPVLMELTWTDEEGQTQRVDSVTCGVCWQPITDVTTQEGGA